MTARNPLLQLCFAGALIVGCRDHPMSTGGGPAVLQNGNRHPKSPLITRTSSALQDNRIGGDYGHLSDGVSTGVYDNVFSVGLKWVRTAFDGNGSLLNWQRVESEPGKYTINPLEDAAITTYRNNGVNILLNLGVGPGDGITGARFATESEIVRYINYVRFMVGHFKGRVRYYELWNEPGGKDPSSGLPSNIGIDVNIWANVISRVVPVIREVDPEAKIVIGALGGDWILGFPGYGEYARSILHIEYLRNLISSGVVPLVDAISWHPFYGNRPDDPYYRTYPEFVSEIKNLAASHGFQGEYFAEEIGYYYSPAAVVSSGHSAPVVSEKVAAKYYARAIVMHLGLDFTVTAAPKDGVIASVVGSLCTVMETARPESLELEIQSQAANVRTYTFSLPGGNRLIALWTDGTGVDDDPGVQATLRLPGSSFQRVVGVDIVNRFEQDLITEAIGGGLIIRNMRVKDYPIILRLLP